MADNKDQRNERLSDLDQLSLDKAAAEAVKGGGAVPPGASPAKPVLKPISPKTIIPCF